jgi:hypothetical protein
LGGALDQAPVEPAARGLGDYPVGWSFLLRLVVVGGDERLRFVPLMFSAHTMTTAYVYARSLPWSQLWLGRLSAALAGCMALLVPSALRDISSSTVPTPS